MNVGSKRLEKVLTALSGRERAILFLREYKDGTNLDPGGAGVAFLTAKEHNEYARLISLIQFCNDELADIVLIVREQLAQEELRFLALEQMRKTADDLWLIGRYLSECVPKPVTAEEKESRKLLQKLVGRGRRYRLPFDVAAPRSENPKDGEETARTITIIIRDRLVSCWVQLKAEDVVLAEYGEEFRGEDPLKPPLREFLDDALARCIALKDDLQEYAGAWELPDDPGDALTLTRKLAERVLG